MSNFPSKLVASRLGHNVAGTTAVTPHFVASLTGYYPEGFPAILEKLKKVAAFLVFSLFLSRVVISFPMLSERGAEEREDVMARDN
jgi:hypothetical protein